MTENRLRERLGFLIIFLHFGLIVLLSVLWSMSGFAFNEFTTTLAILIPILSAYVAGIVTYFSNKRHVRADKSKPVTATFVFLSMFFPVAMSVTLSGIMLIFAFGTLFEDFEQFKASFAIAEGVFAAYLATTTNSLFKPAATN